MKGHLDFTISRSQDGPPEFYLHERCWHEYGPIDSVRACLEQHRDALVERLAALHALLHSEEPERANCLLLDCPAIRVDEVTLRAPASLDRFQAIMHRAWSSGK